ncbi:MAG: type II toxin-antitoxin system VapC family toxin [Chlorobaculum sp.]|nr:type II toxin-antitoxin system VapC family toxin [Chlorobaculum sp.]
MSHSYVTDTMAIILRLERRRLSQNVKKIFDEVEDSGLSLFIPVMVLAEVGYLAERNKIDTSIQEISDYCEKYPSVKYQPITDKIIMKSFEIEDIPELHDRIIAGTALYKNLELITNDPVIRASKHLSTVW